MSATDRKPGLTQALRDALDAEAPADACLELARRLVASGIAQDELEQLYSKEFQLQQARSDEQATEALADTLDLIVGWCRADKALFPK